MGLRILLTILAKRVGEPIRLSLVVGWLACLVPLAARADSPPSAAARDQLARAEAEMAGLERELAVAVQDAGDTARLRKQIELQQKQIEVLQKMVRLLADRVKDEPPSLADLESRSKQAAQRDHEIIQEIGHLREEVDTLKRRGTPLPATLRELYLPTRTNESPLAIFGTLSSDFQMFEDTVSNFPSPIFSPHFYLMLNESFLLEVNPEFRLLETQLESAQLDWFVHDNLTLVLGRFYSLVGFFNERLHTSWIFKTPDRPLMFQQVLPAALSLNGVMAKGATYLGDFPVKLEYGAVVANGLSLDPARPTLRDYADLRQQKDVFNDVNSDKAFAARLGLTFPAHGIWMGVSGMVNGDYDRVGNDLTIWDVDLNYHKGNWDFRFEYAQTNQQSPTGSIRRQGFYTQVAYRDYQCLDPILQKLEGVARFDHVQFDGIDLARTGLAFGGRERIPVDRNRYTVGLNYYAYESLIFKIAYQVNDELRFTERRDNGVIAQVSWGF